MNSFIFTIRHYSSLFVTIRHYSSLLVTIRDYLHYSVTIRVLSLAADESQKNIMKSDCDHSERLRVLNSP